MAEHLGAAADGPDGADGTDAGTFPGGAVLRRGSTGWVLAEERPERALGGALVWAARSHIEQLHVLAEGEEAAGVLARRAAAFRRPPQVWTISGRTVTPAVPAPPLSEEPPTDAHLAFAAMFAAAGAEAVVEHGVLVAEVLGLEVGRVIDGRLDVGVGKHDREAQRLVHVDRPPEEALRAAVAAVREVRRAGAPVHEMNRLAHERWLRSVVMASPQMVGAASLAPLPEPVSRQGLRMAAPAPAAGLDADGRPLVVVCSTGIDVDLVPTAADARLGHDPTARLVIVVPEADDHPVTRDLAAQLADPAEVVAITGDWRDLPVPASR
ncbi:MAG TPA: hypothetical protein VNA57_00725 [Acidimicrobiales bacterium]|nr:hypothetical protein [Acidimicrobiales bacterium]